MFDEHVVFFKRIGIEQYLDTLARRQFAPVMLRLNPRFPPAVTRGLALMFKLLDDIGCGHVIPIGYCTKLAS
jgi:hypothetical protein